MYKYECIIRQYKNDRKSTVMINEGTRKYRIEKLNILRVNFCLLLNENMSVVTLT